MVNEKTEKVRFLHECTGISEMDGEPTAESERDTMLALGKCWPWRDILT